MGSVGNVHGQVRVFALAGRQQHRSDPRVSVARVSAIDDLRARRRQDRPPGAIERKTHRSSGVGADGGDLFARLSHPPGQGAARLGRVGPGGSEPGRTRGESEAEAARRGATPPGAATLSERHAACRGYRRRAFRAAPARLRQRDSAAVSGLRSGRSGLFQGDRDLSHHARDRDQDRSARAPSLARDESLQGIRGSEAPFGRTAFRHHGIARAVRLACAVHGAHEGPLRRGLLALRAGEEPHHASGFRRFCIRTGRLPQAPRARGIVSQAGVDLVQSMKMGADAIWITEAEVVQLMDLKDAIAALEAALREEARGEAHNMTKTLLQYGKNNLHAIGGKLGNLVGTKTWTHTQGGTCPLLLLWSADDGSLVAVIEAFALGNLRTGGISGVAAGWMARQDAKVMAIVGTGKQALAQVGTMLAGRPVERLRTLSPNDSSGLE